MSLREYNFQVFDQESYTGFDISCTVHTAQKEVIAKVTLLTDLSHLHENEVDITDEDQTNIIMILEQLSEENPELQSLIQKSFGVLVESTTQKYLH